MFPKLIALGGVARSGKDTFYQTLAHLRPGSIRISVGDIIRRDCAEFIKSQTGINVHDCTDAEKEIIRPILVGYGLTMRKQTIGTYFIKQLEGIMLSNSQTSWYNPNINYFVMTDLRFAEYEFDEPDWVHSHGGVIVHISRIVEYLHGDVEDMFGNSCCFPTLTPIFLRPPNDTERENNPKIRAKADFHIEWESRNDPSNFEFHVNQFLNWVQQNNNQKVT